MVALAIVLSAVVLLMAVLVAGLLRSHADILRALHDLGAGVGDPAAAASVGGAPRNDRTGQVARSPLTIGPALPPERDSTSAPTVAGVTPGGDALAVSVAGTGHATLLAFLSAGCTTCGAFWAAFARPDRLDLPDGVRLVVVTKGPELEVPAEVAQNAARGLTVIMSTDAWRDYEVPGSPFFALVDGVSGRRIGEGVSNRFEQVVEMVRRAAADAGGFTTGTRAPPDRLDGPERELENDRELVAAGIRPGDPSLYPRSIEELHGAARPQDTSAVPVSSATGRTG